MHAQQARGVLDAARAEVASLQGQIDQNAAACELRLQTGDGGLLPLYQQSARLGDLLRVAESRAEVALKHYHEATAALARIASEVTALLFLRDQEWQEHRLQAELAHQEQLDEVGMRLWQAGQQEHARSQPAAFTA